MNVVVDLLGMTGSQSRKPLHMLAHGLIVLFDPAGRNQRLDGLAKQPLLADTAALAGTVLPRRTSGVNCGTVDLAGHSPPRSRRTPDGTEIGMIQAPILKSGKSGTY